MDNQGVGMRQQFPVEGKWSLGLQSRAQPREIMTDVLKALQELNVCWKKIGPYNMKCIWTVVIPGHQGGMVNDSVHSDDNEVVPKSTVVKFELQLYKTEEKYLLDIQRLEGPQFAFLDLCASFLERLHVLE
ncbi:SNF1-related protein kinase catalytic subunit alpha KIN10 [Medicago truncatula]|uniref:non-specific serine/threonine protein kinase n=1 Tax=Medicago truncatula TaxID=3880 RepID=A0A072U9Y8_MEDTR|nr:SNF1-related protein kinase catalytic subunit alpha KIN10 [Medicago truncatula]KEH26241.1 SNF1-related kinase [Medicago truncatula]